MHLAKKKSASSSSAADPYFRRDQASGISGPDLLKQCTFAEHIVHARGKRTQYTSVSLDLRKIRDFGEQDYQLDCAKIATDAHRLIAYAFLIGELQRVAREGQKEDKIRAVQALRYAKRRKEGLVDWNLPLPSNLPRKDVISWAEGKVQTYFDKI